MSTRTEELMKYDAEHVLHSLGSPGKNYGFALETAQGVRLKDSDGKEYFWQVDSKGKAIMRNNNHVFEDDKAVESEADQRGHDGTGEKYSASDRYTFI